MHNYKFNLQGLIILLALFTFYGCGENEPLGLPINDDDNNINLKYKEFTLPASMVYRDSLSTTRINRIMAGKFIHPRLGTVTAASFSEITLPENISNIPDDAEFDSLVFGMAGNYFYGEHEQEAKQKIAIHRLSDTLEIKNYYKFESAPYQETALGHRTFNINPDEDSTFTIRLNDNLGREILNKAKDESVDLENNSNFKKYFKGLAIIPGSENNIMLGIDPENNFTGMRLFYHSSEDTSAINFTIQNGMYFSNISKFWEGTGLAGKLQEHNSETGPVNGEIYLQSGVGLVPKLNFAPLQSFVEANENQVIINKANLVVGTEPYTHPYIVPPQLFNALFTDESNELTFIQTGPSSSRPRGITRNNSLINFGFDSEERLYNEDITVFAQSVADKNSDFDNILLYPSGINSSINYFIADTSDIKLKVYYTTLK